VEHHYRSLKGQFRVLRCQFENDPTHDQAMLDIATGAWRQPEAPI